MDSKEAFTYFETAEEQLRDAELAFKEGRYALCAFLCASCAENATAALLISLGAKPSKKHRNSLVLNRLVASVPPKVQRSLRVIVDFMKTLEPHITKARYPVRKGLELSPPSKFYTIEIAEKALAQAQKVIKGVKSLVTYRLEGHYPR